MCKGMKVLLGYRDIMELGVSKKNRIQDVESYMRIGGLQKVQSIQSDRYKESSNKVIYQDVSWVQRKVWTTWWM